MSPISTESIISDQPVCPLCGSHADKALFSTTTFLPTSHPLHLYAGVDLHWDCYARWAFQRPFAEAHFAYWSERPSEPLHPVIYRGGDVLLQLDSQRDLLTVLLRQSGSAITVPRDDWRDFLTFDWRNRCQHLLETRSLAAVLGKLAWVRDPTPIVA